MPKSKISVTKYVGIFLTIFSFVMLILQTYLGFMEFTDAITGRTFVIGFTAMFALGFGLQLGDAWQSILKWFGLIACVLFGIYFIGGFSCALADQLGYDMGTTVSDSYFFLDALSTQITDISIIINMFTKTILPAAAIILGIVLFLLADGPDEYTTALIEVGVIVGLLIIFGVLEKFLF
jgi:hypothetical protein